MSVKNINVTHKVWSRFQATQKDGSIIKLRIQDLPWEQHKDNLAEFYMKYFIKDEVFHRAAGIFNKEEAETEYREIVFSYYEEKDLHVSICCLDDDSNINDILGMSLVMELNKSQSEDNVDSLKPKTKEVQNLFHIISLIHDIKPSKGHEKYYEGRGIIVRPDLRGLGIANEFVRLRKQICIENNIQMSSAWMTSMGTQKAAAKNNWKTFMELPVEEFETRTGLLFEADTPVSITYSDYFPVIRKVEISLETKLFNSTFSLKKLELRNGCQVEVVLQRTLRVSQILGVAPLRFASSKTLTFVAISRPWYIYGLTLTMTLNCILFYSMILFLQNEWEYFLKIGFIHLISLLLKCTITSFFVSFCVMVGIKRMQLFKSIVHQIRKINADIGALKYELPKFWEAWFFIFFIAAVCPTVRILYTWVKRIDNTYGFYANVMEYHLMMILVLQFIIIAFYINTALEAVNDKLRELMSAMVNDNMGNGCNISVQIRIPIHFINIVTDTLGMVNPSLAGKKKLNRLKMAHRLRILCKAFVLTCKVLKEFNTHMNCVFVTFYLYFILDFSYHLYNAMNYLQVDNFNTIQYFEIIGAWLRLIFNIIQSIMFVEPFYRAKVEFSRMRLTLCRMMSLVNFGDPMLDDLDAFFKQLLLNNFAYTASGLFSLERNLTYTMIGVVATVLSILQEYMNVADN